MSKEVKEKEVNKVNEVNQVKKDKVETPGAVIWRRLKKNRLAITGMIILIVMILFCLVGPFIMELTTGHTAYKMYGDVKKYAAPSGRFLLGVDHLGRDVLTRTMEAGKISLFVGVVAVAIEVILGASLGIVSGFYGGMVDNIMMRVVDVFMSIPSMPLLIILAAVLSDLGIPPKYRIFVVMGIIGFLAWPGLCRMVRGQVLSLREMEYMQAAEALGLRDRKKMFKHILPNIIPILVVYATLGLAGAILQESALSFLSLGVMPPTPSWGNMIQTVNDLYNLKKRPWLWMPSGFCIFITVMAINLLGDGLRDAIDPKMKR